MLLNFFKNKSGKLVIMQVPNWSLQSAFFFWTTAYLAKNSDYYSFFRGGFLIFLLVWAYFEITNGDSMFRRVLGLVVAINVIMGLYKAWI